MKTGMMRMLLTTGLATAILIGVAAGTPAGLRPSAVYAQDTTTPAPALPRTITVVGDGTVSIKPDVARANIGVEVLKPTVEEAAGESNQVTEQVLAALKEMGIAENDIQTSGYSVYSERYGSDGAPADQIQYRVTNNVTVLIRNLDQVGQVLDASIKAGANSIYGVEFLLDDPTAARSAARKQAVSNANATAQELAELSGVTAGKIISLSEVIGNTGGYYSNQFTQYSTGMGASRAEAPIEPGQLRLTMQLQVTYELVD